MNSILNAEPIQCHYTNDIAELHKINEAKYNIGIYSREITDELKAFNSHLIDIDFKKFNKELKISDFEHLFNVHFKKYNFINTPGYIALREDIKQLVNTFSDISNNPKLKVFFGKIETDMCKRFHVDMYESRMLCTYAGPGTLWLTEDNVNYEALKTIEGNDKIVIDKSKIQQLNTNDIAIIKGALHPRSKNGGVVHRSPTVSKLGQKRIMLRIDSKSLIDNLNN